MQQITNFAMNMMDTTPASPHMTSVKSKQIKVHPSCLIFTDGQVKERGCSTKQNICDDLDSSETACKEQFLLLS